MSLVRSSQEKYFAAAAAVAAVTADAADTGGTATDGSGARRWRSVTSLRQLPAAGCRTGSATADGLSPQAAAAIAAADAGGFGGSAPSPYEIMMPPIPGPISGVARYAARVRVTR